MRRNEYKCIDEFIREYQDGERDPNLEHFIGIEFIYNRRFYRMCCEPPFGYSEEEKKTPFHVYEIVDIDFTIYETIGMYATLQEVLDNCYIQGRKFREVIMDDKTVIDGKD